MGTMNRMADPRRYLTRSGAAATLVVGLAFVALFAGGCSIERPSAPSTEFTLSIPVADDSTQVRDVVGDRSEFLQTDPTTGGMLVHFSKEVGVAEIGDRLRVRPTENRFSTPIGEIHIAGQEVDPIILSMASLLPGIPSGTVPIPATPIDTRASIPLANLTSVTVQEGALSIDLVNGLPVALESLTLTLRDNLHGTVVDVLELGTVAANGGVADGSFSLAGKQISGDLTIEVTGASVATSSAQVSGSPSLRIGAVMSDLVVTEARALIPQQEFSDHQVLDFPDSRVLVTRALISEGGMTMRVRNDIPLIVEVELSLDDLRTPDNRINTFRIDRLAVGETREVRFDLIGNVFAPPDPREMRLSYRVKTVASDQEVTLTSDGELTIEVITEDLVFSEVDGRLNGVRLSMPEVEREVDFPSGLDNVELSAASLDIYITSAIAFLADVDLRVTGTNQAGQSRTLIVEERFERGDPSVPARHQVSAAPADLVAFLNLLPTRVTIAPEVRIGDGLEEESISSNQWVSVDSVVFRTASRLTVTAATQIDPDPRDITFRDSQAKERVESHFRSARIITEVENSLPLGVGVRLFVGRTPEAVYDTGSRDHVLTIPPLSDPSPFNDSFHADAPDVDGQGHSIGSTRNNLELELTEEQVLKFILEDSDRGKLWSGVRIYLPATAGAVEIRDSDFVNTVAGLKVELLLDENLVD
jgi:hypothetical protein